MQQKIKDKVDGIRKSLGPRVAAIVEAADAIYAATGDFGLDVEPGDVERFHLASRELSRRFNDLLDAEALIEQQRNESVEAVASRLRHDMRNVVGVVKGYLEMLIEDTVEVGGQIPSALFNVLSAISELQTEINTVVVFTDIAKMAPEPEKPAAPAKREKQVKGAARTVSTTLDVTGEQEARLKGRILVVDDDKSSRELICTLLRRNGHTAEEAKSGRDAIKKMQLKSFDVVLLDLMMPGMSGYDVMEKMRQSRSMRETRIIVISGMDQEENAIKCIGLGAEDYLSKPVNAILLRTRIGASLARKYWSDQERLYRMQLQSEKSRSEALLLNTLPAPMVKRLSSGEKVIADAHEEVSVLFSDFVGFTSFADSRKATEVVEILNRVFTEFDELARDLGVEKIKTIGDGYLAACGLPIWRPDHVEVIADFALGMIDILNAVNMRFGTQLEMRIGIHSGPVVAGVIGSHKFAYDIWGHTVNVAARHESYSQPQHIHVSSKTAELLRDKFNLTPRGRMFMRGLGDVHPYFLEGRKEVVTTARAPKTEAKGGALNILVADDDLGYLELISRRILKQGWHATVVPDGLEAWKLLKENRFDLLITDCDMPELDGFELAERVRESEEDGGRKTAIVAVTGDDSDECATRCFQAGMDAIVRKPVMWNELLQSIERLCTKNGKKKGKVSAA